MKPLFPFLQPRYVSLTLRAAAILFFAVAAWAAQQPAQQPAQSAGGSTASDEEAKAAERKRRFEEQKKRLEEERPSSPIGAETEVSADQTLFVSPSVTNMLVGDIREFSAFDIDGKILTREAEWTIDDSGIATLNDKGQSTIVTKQPGKATLRARAGSRSAEASITVLDGDKMPNGTIKWSVPNYPGYTSKQMIRKFNHESSAGASDSSAAPTYRTGRGEVLRGSLESFYSVSGSGSVARQAAGASFNNDR